MNHQRPKDTSRRYRSGQTLDRNGRRPLRSGSLRAKLLTVGGIFALATILWLALSGISRIHTTRTFSDGAVDIDLPATMRDGKVNPANTVLACEDRFRGIVIGAYTMPDNDRNSLRNLANGASRMGSTLHKGGQITMTGFPSRIRLNGTEAYQLQVSGNSNGRPYKGRMTFLHVANRNYAVMTAASAGSYKRRAKELDDILKTIRATGTSVGSEESSSMSGGLSTVSTVPAKPHVRAQFESVATAINVLKNNRLSSNVDQEANHCETDKGWRSSAVTYLKTQPMSPTQQSKVIECIDEIVQSEDTFLDRNEFYETLVRSKWELPDSAMLELSTRMLQGDNQVSLHSFKDELVSWVKKERPESLAEMVIDAAIQRNNEGEKLITTYPQRASLRVFKEKMEGSVSSHQITNLQKLVGVPDFAEVQGTLLEVLNDTDDDNDKLVLEYLVDKSPTEASSELRSKVSEIIASKSASFAGRDGHLSKLTDDWLMKSDHGLLIETFLAASEHERKKLMPVAMSLNSEAVLQGVVDSIDSGIWVSHYADHLPQSPDQRDLFEILLIKSCDISDPDRVGKCCALLAEFGGARSVVAINNARDWAYDNGSFHLRVAADRALKKLAGRVNIDTALRDREQHLSELRPTRTWTSGKFTLEAKLIEIDKKHVVLEKKDGSIVRVEISRLDEEDQQYVDNLPAGW